MPGRGKFIVFEGGEGAGKTTQIERTASYLRERGIHVITTREPGGTGNAEALRHVIVNGRADGWQPLSEVLVMFAARFEHVVNVIKPALQRGHWVVCDRFIDSSLAYQGAGGDVPNNVINTLIDWTVVHQGVMPDLTFLLDVDPAEGLMRAASRDEEKSRFEDKDVDFHRRVRKRFVELAARGYTGPHVQIDASLLDQDQVQYGVREALAYQLGVPRVAETMEGD